MFKIMLPYTLWYLTYIEELQQRRSCRSIVVTLLCIVSTRSTWYFVIYFIIYYNSLLKYQYALNLQYILV